MNVKTTYTEGQTVKYAKGQAGLFESKIIGVRSYAHENNFKETEYWIQDQDEASIILNHKNSIFESQIKEVV
jgi:hypothetical protein